MEENLLHFKCPDEGWNISKAMAFDKTASKS